MKRAGGTGIGVALVVAILGSQGMLGAEQRRARSLKAVLTGFEEPPSFSTAGRGKFEVKISRDDESFDYELSFGDLEGTVTQAHIHIAQPGVNGGIAIWLCGTTPGNPGPAGTPDCGGPNAGTVTGTAMAAQVVDLSGQGIAPGEFAEVLRAMRAGFAYANVHSTRRGAGEIRGQIRPDDGEDDDRHDR